jgi:hypothetical protein
VRDLGPHQALNPFFLPRGGRQSSLALTLLRFLLPLSESKSVLGFSPFLPPGYRCRAQGHSSETDRSLGPRAQVQREVTSVVLGRGFSLEQLGGIKPE